MKRTNRKRTKGRIIQVINDKNTGKLKFIHHVNYKK